LIDVITCQKEPGILWMPGSSFSHPNNPRALILRGSICSALEAQLDLEIIPEFGAIPHRCASFSNIQHRHRSVN
jgi:hypothetical protein